jgi:hypothetical protein
MATPVPIPNSTRPPGQSLEDFLTEGAEEVINQEKGAGGRVAVAE